MVACGAGVDGAGGNGAENSGANNSGGSTSQFMNGGGGEGGFSGDPQTCEQAAQAKTYLGCDFYPTVTANNVWSVFDYAVVVANAGQNPADITVTRGGAAVTTASVQPNQLATIYLPWVTDLKGPDADECGSATPLGASVRSPTGAYHLTSTVPVTVYQFSPLEYAPQGGPPGKDWSSCPAQFCFLGIDCKSYSNDASLLLPSTAQTGNFRVFGYPGWQAANLGATLTVTGLFDNTNVTVSLGAQGAVLAGGGIAATSGGGQVTFSLNQGEVVELVGNATSDFSGSLVQADQPVQVISGLPCRNIPDTAGYCDHIEESVFPAETLGEHYIVTTPTGPLGSEAPYVVRLYGNVDGTTLTYPGVTPPGAPATLDAGQVVDLGQINQSFEVIGSNAFGVATFLLGSTIVNPGGGGDPSMSVATAVEQYRTKYVFLAPTDYQSNFVDVVMPMGAALTLDGAAVTQAATPISSGFGVARVPLSTANNGAHVMTSDVPFGIQVIGYGVDTSYMYPGGLNLELIAPPPPPPE